MSTVIVVLDMLVVVRRMHVDVRLALVRVFVDTRGFVRVFVDHCAPVIS